MSCIGNPTNFGGLLAYSINSSTGALTQVPGSPFHTDYSIALAFDRTGKFAYEVGWASSFGTPKFRLASCPTGHVLPGAILLAGDGLTVSTARLA